MAQAVEDETQERRTSDDALGQNHSPAAVFGVFKNNPVLDAVREEVYPNRHRMVAELEAEIEAENAATE